MKKGFTLLETLIYITIFSAIIFVIFKSVTTTLTIHKSIKLSQILESSGTISLERILREIRNASAIDMIGSSFGSTPGVLKLSGVDNNGVSYTTVFDLSGGILRITKDSGTPNPLTAQNIQITSLIFRNVSNTNSSAVKVEISFSGGVSPNNKILDLFGFAVLRGSY